MSNTGPFGHQPTSLSTGMGLSDPRLRRALQLGSVTDQSIGFGLKIDSQGRLSVDSAGLAGDQTTITNIVQSFANFSSSNTTTITGGGFDGSLFDDWLSNTALYGEVEKLVDAVGIYDDQYGWFSGGSALYGNASILRHLGTQTLVGTVWSEMVEIDHTFLTGQGFPIVPAPEVSVTVPVPISGNLRKNVTAHIKINIYDEDLNGSERMAAAGFADLLVDLNTTFEEPYRSIPLNNWAHNSAFTAAVPNTDTPSRMWFFGFAELGPGGNTDPDPGETVFVSTDHGTWQQYYMENPHGDSASELSTIKSYVQYPYANGATWVHRTVPIIDDLPETCTRIKFRFSIAAVGTGHDATDSFTALIKIRVSHDLHNNPFTM